MEFLFGWIVRQEEHIEAGLSWRQILATHMFLNCELEPFNSVDWYTVRPCAETEKLFLFLFGERVQNLPEILDHPAGWWIAPIFSIILQFFKINVLLTQYDRFEFFTFTDFEQTINFLPDHSVKPFLKGFELFAHMPIENIVTEQGDILGFVVISES